MDKEARVAGFCMLGDDKLTNRAQRLCDIVESDFSLGHTGTVGCDLYVF